MREFDVAMQRAFKRLNIKPGDIYESCSYHPCVCLGVDYKNDHIWGISLIDGSYPRSCSLLHCGVRKITPKQAWQIKMHGPLEAEAREGIPSDRRWWNPSTENNVSRVGLIGPRKPAKARAQNSASPTVASDTK